MMKEFEFRKMFNEVGIIGDKYIAESLGCSKSQVSYFRLILNHAMKNDVKYLLHNMDRHGSMVKYICKKLNIDLYKENNMNSVDLLNNEIAELEKQLEAKKKELEEAKKPKVWKPKYGDKYFCVTPDGKVCCFEWHNNETDNAIYSLGNRFKTQEEAEFEIEKLKVIAELKRFAEEHNTASIDWNISNQFRYYIYYDYFTKLVGYHWANMCRRNDIYFTSKELAEQAVKQIGEDRVKKYYLGVE